MFYHNKYLKYKNKYFSKKYNKYVLVKGGTNNETLCTDFKIKAKQCLIEEEITNYDNYIELLFTNPYLTNKTDILIIFLQQINLFNQEILKLVYDLTKINWYNLDFNLDIQKKLYIIRYAIVYLVILTAYNINNYMVINNLSQINILQNKARITNILLIKDIYFEYNIDGSSEILSDIDINIDAPCNSSFWISIIEDLLQEIKWFNHLLWRVDFYGDPLYVMNTNNQKYYSNLIYSNETQITLLKILLVAISKSNRIYNQNIFFIESLYIFAVENIFSRLGESYKQDIISKINIFFNYTLDDKIKNLNDNLDNNFNNNEKYYELLKKCDDLSKNMATNINLSYKTEFFFDDFVLSVAYANLYRNDNYIIIDSVYHVVKCNQTNTKIETCNKLTIFSYVISIIEQCWFLLENLENIDSSDLILCTMSANKYFNRMLNALIKIQEISSIFEDNYVTIIKKYYAFSNILLLLKKKRSSKGNTNKKCEINDSIDTEYYEKIKEKFTNYKIFIATLKKFNLKDIVLSLLTTKSTLHHQIDELDKLDELYQVLIS